MKENSPLIIYDCDGTMELSLVFAYALAKQKDGSLTLSSFKASHPGENKALVPGIGDLVRYTADVGNNVLLSGGCPTEEGSQELKSLFGYFQNWTYNGSTVPFGQEPFDAMKDNPKVAKALLNSFHPSAVVVIGDTESECRLAQNIRADVLLLYGAEKERMLDAVKDVPNKYAVKDVQAMMSILKKFFSHPTHNRNKPSPTPSIQGRSRNDGR